MDTSEPLPSPPPRVNRRPEKPGKPDQFALRYTMNDLLCVPALFALHMGLGMLLIQRRDDTERVVACAVLSATLAFCAAYLTHRLCTKKRIEDFGTRLTWLLLLDLMLIVIWPAVALLIATGPWIPLLIVTFFIGYATGRNHPPVKIDPYRVDPRNLQRVIDMETAEIENIKTETSETSGSTTP